MSSPRPSIYARYPRGGRTAREMAERAGMSVRTAQRWTSEPRSAFLGRARERGEEILALRATGMTMRAIAAEVGCSVGTVHRHIAAARERERA